MRHLGQQRITRERDALELRAACTAFGIKDALAKAETQEIETTICKIHAEERLILQSTSSLDLPSAAPAATEREEIQRTRIEPNPHTSANS